MLCKLALRCWSCTRMGSTVVISPCASSLPSARLLPHSAPGAATTTVASPAPKHPPSLLGATVIVHGSPELVAGFSAAPAPASPAALAGPAASAGTPKRCAVCGKSRREGGKPLLKCGRCLAAFCELELELGARAGCWWTGAFGGACDARCRVCCKSNVRWLLQSWHDSMVAHSLPPSCVQTAALRARCLSGR